MKPAWLLLTLMLVAAVIYLGRQETSQASPTSSAQDEAAAPPASSGHRLAAGMERKLERIRTNAARSHPDPTPTVISEEEVNDYLASGNVNLPVGVKKVTLQGNAGTVNALVKVDFDQLRAGQRSSNPLLAVFSGIHDVGVEAGAAGSGGEGKVHVRTVTIDSVEVPRMALEFFVQKFVTPKYPNVGLDSTFQLPDRIDTATVGYHKLTMVQK